MKGKTKNKNKNESIMIFSLTKIIHCHHTHFPANIFVVQHSQLVIVVEDNPLLVAAVGLVACLVADSSACTVEEQA